ncbi:nuclear transport factor 2 family protein [Pontibacter sp. BT310]|jgi:ketosteroid isomerase-like protein|uniref:Nuclear transport factor 2 family protein n=1 Tax=Pontibacter populi TaxID=890055 RepID=A0ABS6XCH0_9BACT|nr:MULTISPECIES: nuclear transport factor 2 family protein [Pontibacter]MBJ6117938.1 nuclear transport factor 2 family protein [Pontibacter sp. BT310]MBR0570365.1 nuclear transport factor 2 family protein [Microvirga sp. STS03]MBW3364791.1 nuclear transport factor 2 family protein [Pontibacter populi]
MRSLIVLFFAVFLFTSCQKTEDVKVVQDLNKAFIDAWNDKDENKLEEMLAEDVDFVQGEIHYSGKSEVAKKWVEETIETIDDLRLDVVSSGIDNKMAYEAGTFTVDVLPDAPGQPGGEGEGNFMLLWKKGEDGTWKLSYAQLEDLPVQVKM